MIYLYHGTDKEFDVPLPERGRRGTDFGQGFYLTPHFDSAGVKIQVCTIFVSFGHGSFVAQENRGEACLKFRRICLT